MTKTWINQQTEEIEASIEKIEPYLTQEEFVDYCENACTIIAYWKKVLKSSKNSE